ncbi:PP2C family protein-serine/threonine phosphatase [Actinokineospora terrae]|uniref:Serine phosphatase RsbU, regulator of sigma subunit n=1 Tax=Actinokineospora terrae TaxID=155974 RepID=A0A1H9MJ23_9PSEU|nr:GAF domain-containing SpoIIE family protein phosphatase [Actinokineospora terrae]SER23648.1 Serine phosphatase RsbU, regulator of sigma subunit [Actinokineospora terrae]
MGQVAGLFPGGVRADGLPAALSDPGRLAAVAATGLAETAAEDVFDDLARLAAALTGVGRAFVTLVDDKRSYWKSCVGVDLDPSDTAARQSPVRESFCYFLVGLEGDPFVVSDAAADPRTRDHPSVAPMRIGAWAGYPILAPGGEVLGSMCVIDDVPREWGRAELAGLATLARSVGNEMHLRQSLAATRSALATSAALARSLQESLLPPVLASVPGVDAAASYLPATGDTVLGDFYDLFPAHGPWWCAVLGDVCGHGTEAAKITALARYTVRAEATRHLSPAAVLSRLNTAMITQRGYDRFLTAAYLTFRTTADGVSGHLCTAGHPPALIRRADGSVRPLGLPGTLLGMLDDVTLTDVQFDLAPGDALLLYTDGATEARDADGAFFGEEGLMRALDGVDATDMTDRITRALTRHRGDHATDDTALLVLRVPG